MLRGVYHATRPSCKVSFPNNSNKPAGDALTPDPVVREVLSRVAELTAQGLDATDAILAWLVKRAGGFIPEEVLTAAFGWSRRTTFRHLSRIKPFLSRTEKHNSGGVEAPSATNGSRRSTRPATAAYPEVATAREGPVPSHVTELTQRQTDSDHPVPKNPKALSLSSTTDSCTQPVCHPTKNKKPGGQTPPTLQPMPIPCPGVLLREIRDLAQQWRMPSLVRTLPKLLGMIVADHNGEYVPGALTEAATITDTTWNKGRIHTSKTGYLVGVFRNLLAEALADITTLRRTKELLEIVGAEPEDIELRLWDEIESRLWKAGAHRLAAQTVAHELLPERFWPPIHETIRKLTHLVGYGVHSDPSPVPASA